MIYFLKQIFHSIEENNIPNEIIIVGNTNIPNI